MLVNNKYRIVKELGKGKFGKVYQATDLHGTKVAIKYDVSNLGMLRHEATILNYLHQRQCNTNNIPKIHWYGKVPNLVEDQKTDGLCPVDFGDDDELKKEEVSHTYSCLVIPYYECTLSEYITSIKDPIHSSKNIRSLIGSSNSECGNIRSYLNRIMIQSMLSILEAIHNVYVIHRDLKPENFMMKHGQVYLIDFGLSTFFVDGDNGEHVPINTEPKQDLVGSPLYASIHVHRGYKASRRDDCIQLGYIWLYMAMGGNLPWSEGRMPSHRDLRSPNTTNFFREPKVPLPGSAKKLGTHVAGSKCKAPDGVLDHTKYIESDMSFMKIQHPMNQERYYQKQNILAKLDLSQTLTEDMNPSQQIQDYLVKCYALEYDEKPNYILSPIQS